MAVQYTEWRTLANRGPVDPAPDEEVQGTLLVGTKAALKYRANQSSYGEDHVEIFPAFHNGTRCWVSRDSWDAAYGYSASGTSEAIISFEDGVKLFIERGVFEFPQPATQSAPVPTLPKNVTPAEIEGIFADGSTHASFEYDSTHAPFVGDLGSFIQSIGEDCLTRQACLSLTKRQAMELLDLVNEFTRPEAPIVFTVSGPSV